MLVLLKNNYRRDAVKVLRTHAKLLHTFVTDSNNPETKHNYFLQTLSLLKHASTLTNDIWIECSYLQSPTDLLNISLPIQRELVDIKLDIAQLLTDMLETNLIEVKTRNAKNLNQNNVTKTLEHFLATGEDLSTIESEWLKYIPQLPDLIFNNLIACHNLSARIKQFRGRTLFLAGRCLRLISELKLQQRTFDINDPIQDQIPFSMPVSKWSPLVIELIKAQQVIEVDSKEKGSKGSKSSQLAKSNVTGPTQSYLIQSDIDNTNPNNITADYSDHLLGTIENSSLHLILEQENFKNLLVSINQSEAQAMDALFQALNIAFSIENKTLVRDISYELIELIGRFDLQICTQMIALFQSCANGIEIEQVIEKSAKDPKSSLLVSYLHQEKFFQSKSVTLNLLNSPVIKSVLDATKAKFNAFKYLNPTLNHFNLSKDLPANYLVVIMQHNRTK